MSDIRKTYTWSLYCNSKTDCICHEPTIKFKYGQGSHSLLVLPWWTCGSQSATWLKFTWRTILKRKWWLTYLCKLHYIFTAWGIYIYILYIYIYVCISLSISLFFYLYNLVHSSLLNFTELSALQKSPELPSALPLSYLSCGSRTGRHMEVRYLSFGVESHVIRFKRAEARTDLEQQLDKTTPEKRWELHLL